MTPPHESLSALHLEPDLIGLLDVSGDVLAPFFIGSRAEVQVKRAVNDLPNFRTGDRLPRLGQPVLDENRLDNIGICILVRSSSTFPIVILNNDRSPLFVKGSRFPPTLTLDVVMR